VKAAAIQVSIPRMADFEESTLTLADGYSAYARYWPGDGARGSVLYHHGIQSHCGWYADSARRLARAGFAVLQVDRRGCGSNARDRGHAESAAQLIHDSAAARDELLRRSGSARYHLVGVSWGGKLAAAGYATEPAGVASVSLVTPGLFPRMVASQSEKAEIGFAMLYEPNRLFDIPLNDPALFTASLKWQAFFRDDPLTLRQCTAGFYLASRRMDRIVARLAAAPPVPVHLLLAGDEQVIDNDKTREFIDGLGWPGSRVTTFPAARHSLEFETIAEDYFGELLGFIDAAESGQTDRQTRR